MRLLLQAGLLPPHGVTSRDYCTTYLGYALVVSEQLHACRPAGRCQTYPPVRRQPRLLAPSVFSLSALVGVWLCGAGQHGQGGTLRCQPEGQPAAGSQPPTSYHSGFLWEDEPLGPGLHPGPLSTQVLRWERWLAATGVLQLCGMQTKARGGQDPEAGEATDTQGDMSSGE